MSDQPLKADYVLDTVMRQFNVGMGQLSSTSRQQSIVWAKISASYLLNTQSRRSFPEIAALLGRRSHSTFADAARRWNKVPAHHRNAMNLAMKIGPSARPKLPPINIRSLTNRIRAAIAHLKALRTMVDKSLEQEFEAVKAAKLMRDQLRYNRRSMRKH